MKFGFYNFYNVYNNNKMFTDASAPIGDDLMYPFVHLGEYLKRRGHEIATIDTAPLESFDAIVFFDYPTKWNRYFRTLLRSRRRIPLYLVTFEAETLRPDNWRTENHAPFEKIFTWKTDLIDEKRYIWLNQSIRIDRERRHFDPGIKEHFCTIISGNKFCNHPLELYSERVRAIRWFERCHPEEFDLYGVGWDRLYAPWAGKLNFGLAAVYRTLPWLPKLSRYPSYRGKLSSKRDTLRRYRFSICYENAVIPGYITEKLFDCFMAGVVPVYLGAPNIADYIPKDTFIDRRDFPTYEALYDRLKSMTADEHLLYLESIWQVLNSDAVRPWSAEYFAQTLEREITS